VKGESARRITLFMLHSAIYHFGLMGIPDVLLNFYFASIGYSPDTIALLQGLSRVGGLLTGLPIGLYVDRIGARRIILLSTIGVAGAFLALAAFPSLTMLAINRFLIGMFYGAGQIALAPFMTTLATQDRQTRLYATHNIISMGSAAAGSFVGGFLPAIMIALLPWGVVDVGTPAQSPFAYGISLGLAALLVFASAIPLLGVAESTSPTPSTAKPRLLRPDMPWLRLTWYGVPLLLFGFSGGLTFPFYNLFFRSTFTLDDATVGTILGIGWVGMALVPMLNPRWERQFGRVRAIGFTLSIAAVAFFALSVAPSLLWAVLAYAVAISTRNTMQPLFQPLLMNALPDSQRAIASSIGFVQWNIGWFIATSISGVWQIDYGFDFIMQVVAACVLVNAVTIVVIFRRKV
jgi:MFS family permease